MKVVSDFCFEHWKCPIVNVRKSHFLSSKKFSSLSYTAPQFLNISLTIPENMCPITPLFLEIGEGYSSLTFCVIYRLRFQINAPPLMSIFGVKERDFQVSQRAASTCLTAIPPLRTEAAGASWGRKGAGRGFEPKPNL